MTAERVDIQVTGKVSPGIETGIRAIAKASLDAHSALGKMQQMINSFDGTKLTNLLNGAAMAAQKLATEQQRTALVAQKLATEQQRTAVATANAAAAQSRATTAATQGATAQQQLAAATTRATAAAQASAAATTMAAARLATEQQRTAAAAAAAAAATDRQALAALRLAQAQAQAGNASAQANTSLRSFLATAISIAGVSVSTSSILQMADSFVVMQNKLQNVTTSQEQVNLLTGKLYDLSNKTLTSVEATTTAFTRFDRSLKNMGKSQEETLRMTETINKALIVGGSTATEASSALLQLSQAFNAGKLQGDEFRSISENMPMVLDAVAKAMNQPIAQVKKLSTEGKITAEVMYKAFKIMEEEVDKTFAKSTLTLSQGFTVLRNKAQQFFGELNNATGVTTAISRGMITLGNNLGAVAIGITAVGAAMLVYFGPTLLSTLNAATMAMYRFTAAVAANPFGLLAVGIAAAVAAITLYGDELMVAADKSVTLKDLFRTAWDDIKNVASSAADVVNDAWNSLFDYLGEATAGFSERFRNIWALITLNVKTFINTFVSLFVAAYSAISIIWDNLPNLAKAAFAKIVNFGAEGVESLVGLFKTGALAIIDSLSAIAPGMAASLKSALDGMKFELPRMQVDEAGAKAGNELQQSIVGAFNNDFVGNAIDSFMDRASKKAAARIEEQNKNANALLRGSGEALPTGNTEGGKAAEKRATALAKVNTQLDNELARMNMLKPARELQQRYDQIEEQMIGKKIKLSEDEITSIKSKIAALAQAAAVQGQMDRMYDAVNGPLTEYNASLSAANNLLKQNAISQQQYAGFVAQAGEAYANATNPLREYTQQMEFERSTVGMSNDQREIAVQLRELEQSLLSKGTVLTQQETAAITAQMQATQQAQRVQSAYNEVYGETQGKLEGLKASYEALNMALANGTVGMSYYQAQMASLNTEAAKLRIAMDQALPGDAFQATFGQMLAGYQGFTAGAIDAMGQLFSSLQDGIANSLAGAIMGTQDLGEALRNVATSAVQEFISQMIKLGIQYVINQSLGVASATAVGAAQVAATGAATAASVAGTATVTAASTAAAATTTAAWTPAAIWASIGSFGQAAVIAGGAILAVKALGGFEKGGYTGDYGRQSVAGVVHGGEYVMTADTVNRVGVDQLEAIQRGSNAAATSASGGTQVVAGGGTVVNVNVINNMSGAQVTKTEQKDEQGNTDITLQIDSIENALASRVASGRGSLHKATRDAFTLQPSTVNR